MLVGQVERLQTEVAEQAKFIEDLKLSVTVRDAKIAEQADEIAPPEGPAAAPEI